MSAKLSNPKDLLGGNKIPIHLWPTTATVLGSLAFLDGALKYGRANWRAVGVRSSIYRDAIDRHLNAWFEGEDLDPDSGLPHLAHILASTAIIVDAKAAGKLEDDRMIEGGYRYLIDRLTPHVARLKAQYADRTPKHYTIADNPKSCGCRIVPGVTDDRDAAEACAADGHCVNVCPSKADIRRQEIASEADSAASLAYTEAARKVYGDNLDTPFIDELPVMESTLFTRDGDPRLYLWDGVGSVLWNVVTGHDTVVVSAAAIDEQTALESFASGDWVVAPHGGLVVTNAFKPSNEASSNVLVLFGVFNNENVSVFIDNTGKTHKNYGVAEDYAYSEDWQEVA